MRKVWLAIMILCLAANSGCAKKQINELPTTEDVQQQQTSAETDQEEMMPDPVEEEPNEPENQAEPEEQIETTETILVTTTVYSNGKDDEDGIDLVVYTCDADTLELQQLIHRKIYATYPANIIDFEQGIFYFADADERRLYDNLYAYNLVTGEERQLTDGKFAFNDFLMVDGQLYSAAAREYCNAVQPAYFDMDEETFTYRDESDDDTFFASFSYDRYEDAFLVMTFQFSEQRTHRVAAETHITPKTISWLSKDLQEMTPCFFTEDFEINLTRRLDENHILMTTEPYMTAKRTLKMLNIETQEVTDFDIPGIRQVYMFYPSRDENTIFLIGQDFLPSWHLYRYEMDTQTLTQIELPETTRQIVDVLITEQPSSSD